MTRPPHRILICDDDDDVRTLLEVELGACGFRMHSVTNGLDALALIEKEHFDLMVLDIVMPGISGLETLRRMQRAHLTDRLPVVVLTALDADAVGEQCLELGARGFVPKPIDFQGLMKVVLTVILGWDTGLSDAPRPSSSR